jgi:predicted  nucleic acid-binding Zn ribbon protein
MSSQLAEALATWRSFHDCFYKLWLDSGEFEEWARLQLCDPHSPVNARALSLRSELDQVHRTYYWWFQAVGADDFKPLDSCPICRGKLVDVDLVGLVCDTCSVLVAN